MTLSIFISSRKKIIKKIREVSPKKKSLTVLGDLNDNLNMPKGK